MNFRWLLLLRFRLSRTDLKSCNKLCWNGYVYNSNNVDSCCSLNIFTKLPFYYFSRQINVCYKLNARIWREINCAQKLRHIMQSETEIGTNWFFFHFMKDDAVSEKKLTYCSVICVVFYFSWCIVLWWKLTLSSNLGLAMISAIKEFDEDRHESVNMRVGIHTGTVIQNQ